MPEATNPFLEFMDRYAGDTELFIREVLGVGEDVFAEVEGRGRIQVQGIYPDQLELIDAYNRRERRISKRSGHGPGKTTSLAWIICHHSTCRYKQKTVCTAPTSGQLFDALYTETVSWFNRLPKTIRDLFEVKSESIELIAAPEDSFVSFRTSSADKPEALAGVHSDWVLLIVDEASGVPEAIFESASGSMSGHNACTILTGNPTRTSGLFYDSHMKEELDGQWVRLHVSSEGHPNVSPDFITQMKAQYGENSDAYRVRVLGEFPQGEANTVIPAAWIEAALKRDVKAQLVRPIWGVDIGESHDPSALCKRRGNALDEPTEEFHANGELMRVVGWVKGHWDRTLPSQRPSDICIDSIGIGSGVASRLRELGLPARSVNVAESPAMKDQYMRLRDELWWKGREWFEKRDCNIAGDLKLKQELVRPTYTTTVTNKVQVEPKKATKKRTRSKSPNRADSFILTHASEAITASAGDNNVTSWNQPLQREIGGLV
jgi:hypothetical protein